MQCGRYLPHFDDRATVHDLDRIFRQALLERANLCDKFPIARKIALPPGIFPVDGFVDHLIGSQAIEDHGRAGAELRSVPQNRPCGRLGKQVPQMGASLLRLY
jgi:hypothetical protein